MAEPHIEVISLPVSPNPYQGQIAAAVKPHGVNVRMMPSMPTPDWLRQNVGRVHILHLHWLYGIYMARYRTPLRLAAFLQRLSLARRLGYRIVWTAHNILPHRTELQPLHNAIRAYMMRSADAVIVHCRFGEEELRRRYERQGPMWVIPIGNMTGLFPITMNAAEARAALGLRPEQFVYLFLGLLAPYKGLDLLLEAFSNIAGAEDALVIAGASLDSDVSVQVQSAAQADSRILAHLAHVPDEDMQRYLLTGDALVAPYRKVLTSGTAILGLSYGLPLITPRLGCLPETIPSDAGILYDPVSPTGLQQAMIAIKAQDPTQMRASALAGAERLNWEAIGRQTVAVYRSCLEQRE
ncbi:MAG: glycosyltransferase [Chloroflexota bacterium]